MSVQLQSTFDMPRPQSHQGLHSSPVESPREQRPPSRISVHDLPGPATFSPLPGTHQLNTPQPLSAYPAPHPQPFKTYQPGNLSLPLPSQPFMGNYPSTAPPLQFYPGPSPLYDTRISQPMIRTISHAHPMHSATDYTVSSRYSSSPHSATYDAPPTASYTSFRFDPEDRHINPSLFNHACPMSRSTSGASDAQEINTRLLTPQYEYRALNGSNHHETELRKVSDSLGRLPSSRFYPHPSYQAFDHHGFSVVGLGPHAQPEVGPYANGTRGWGSDFAISSERGDSKPESGIIHAETDYERERNQQIVNNKKLMEEMGLHGLGTVFSTRNRATSGISHERGQKTTVKRRLPSETPIRVSPRIASQPRNVSYTDLDGGRSVDEASEEEYISDQDEEFHDLEEEDEFRPMKRSKGHRGGYARKPTYTTSNRIVRKAELSLWGLLEVYPQVPHLFPLFYYTLNNDLTINSDSVPLIGSIPSTASPLEKGETLKNFFHRGRRALAQLDAFTLRCDRKYEGPGEKWEELDAATRVAVRDVRRKVVERCENYKYTRRDLLDKCLGKNKWHPIEQDLVDWKVGSAQNDPAGDLVNVTLTLPTPPPSVGMYGHRTAIPGRHIKPFPTRRATSGLPSAGLPSASARTVSINMDGDPDPAPVMSYSYPACEPAPPMYGEDEVPMTVQMPMPPSATRSHAPSPMHEHPSSDTLAPEPAWDEEPKDEE